MCDRVILCNFSSNQAISYYNFLQSWPKSNIEIKGSDTKKKSAAVDRVCGENNLWPFVPKQLQIFEKTESKLYDMRYEFFSI